MPSDPLRMIAFFKQCQVTNKAAGVLDKITKDKSSQRKKKQLMFLPHVAVNQATISFAVITTVTIIKATNTITMITNLTIVIEAIDATIALNLTTRTQKAPSPMTRRMIASKITPRKGATRPCVMTSPPSQVLAFQPEKVVNLVQDLLCLLILVLLLLKQPEL